MNTLNKITSLSELLAEKERIQRLQQENSLLMKMEMQSLRLKFKPITNIISLVSPARTPEEKFKKKELIKRYLRIVLPLAATTALGFTKFKVLAKVAHFAKGLIS
ncbi:hypothetical protein C3K47_06025 [Solitalea longa]|uniref:Uncharacterized protein n=1 Tax=Solitalea longa TaxID=2079460 RepID=A0A2S5A412_9SPHI|nr:hypothetical protein [Solitalea longa]POY37321.1 hypothetical protein C3K47_06025 [Solitalea longa]